MPAAERSRVYVIVGATGGIGSELCRMLAARGHQLVVVARNRERLQALAEEVNGLACVLDATDSGQVDGCLSQALERHGRIDGAACCVGSLLLKPAHTTSDSEWATTLALNLTTAFFTLRAAVRTMSSSGGSVVLVSSAAARLGLSNHEAIAAAKAGIVGLTLSAAASYSGRGIRVNCVAPGLVRTPLTARLTTNEASLKASESMHALGRVGEPADVASAIAWLLGPESSWVTGQVLGVDGGLATVRAR